MTGLYSVLLLCHGSIIICRVMNIDSLSSLIYIIAVIFELALIFEIAFCLFCYFLFRQQGVWKNHCRLFFPLCTWSEPCELPQDLTLFFSESGSTGNTIGLFLCIVLGPFWAQRLIHYSWSVKCLCTLLLRARGKHCFSIERLTVA